MHRRDCKFYKAWTYEEGLNHFVTVQLCLNKKRSSKENEWKNVFGFEACGCDLFKFGKCNLFKKKRK